MPTEIRYGRRLHVWQNPILHPKVADKTKPVEVIFNDDEFDWWEITPDGQLHIGYTRERYFSKAQLDEREFRGAPYAETYFTRDKIWVIQKAMWAQVHVEEYSEEVEIPDAVPSENVETFTPPKPAWASGQTPMTELQQVPQVGLRDDSGNMTAMIQKVNESVTVTPARDRFSSGAHSTVTATLPPFRESHTSPGSILFGDDTAATKTFPMIAPGMTAADIHAAVNAGK